MKQSILFILIANVFFICTSCGTTLESKHKPIIPEAKPVSDFFSASKTGDIALIKSAYSENMKNRIGSSDEEWKAFTKKYQDYWPAFFGEYDLNNLHYRFEGNDSKGIIYVTYKVELPGLMVIKEKSGWKINER